MIKRANWTMGASQFKEFKFLTKSDRKMSNVFHRDAGSKIQLFARLAVCFHDIYTVVLQAIPPLGMQTPLCYCGKGKEDPGEG